MSGIWVDRHGRRRWPSSPPVHAREPGPGVACSGRSGGRPDRYPIALPDINAVPRVHLSRCDHTRGTRATLSP